MSDIELPSPPLPPLTADDFRTGHAFHGVDIIEDEDGDTFFTYGHVPADTFAAAVDGYDVEVAGMVMGVDTEPNEPDDVTHRYAVTVASPDSAGEWQIYWGGVTAETPGSFPVTVMHR